ncbi:MAG: Tex-like N-terminal domain-containing protein [Mycoplasmatales bacterium]
MNEQLINELSKQMDISVKQIRETIQLLADGSTVPFIARYRKEMTGGLDEEQIRSIQKEYEYGVNLQKRKEEIIRLIDEKGMLTPELEAEINQAQKLQTIEDLYLPYKEKRKTKATEAIKMGLEPLADFIYSFPVGKDVITKKAEQFITEEVKTIDDALTGAKYILAERIADSAKYRDYIRKFTYNNGILVTKIKKNAEKIDEKKKYEMYYNFTQVIKKLPAYRILAFNRAEKEKVISVKFDLEIDRIHEYLEKNELKKLESEAVIYVKAAIVDAYKRLISPSIEREIRAQLTEFADESAFTTFSQNLDVLIMQPPLKNIWVLGVDPAFRTGCKLAVINDLGGVEAIDVIYPTMPKNDVAGAKRKLKQYISKYPIGQIVVGNGTASRETHLILEDFLKEEKLDIKLTIVSEAGASVYSASKLAQAEFPDLKVEERSAVSIARRVQDPMAELVKIDPKAIGVGQYQHDVNQTKLAENLDFVMIKNINKVGVDVNTASAELLKYVSGLDKTIAKNIVEYRQENGKIKSRAELKKVKRLGPKAFEQSAGFLKILDGREILDTTFIHPENYKLAKQLIKDYQIEATEIGTEMVFDRLTNASAQSLAEQYECSPVVIDDIVQALVMKNIDIRQEIIAATFDKKISTIEELSEGLVVEGQVRNIVEFGAFVDIGLKNDGLVHISELSTKFVKDVNEVLAIGEVRRFKIKSIDLEKGKVQLTMKDV